MKLSRTSLTLGLLAILASILVACGTPTLKVTLIASDIEWNITTINAKVGQPIEITVTNAGALDHDLVIEELGVDILLSPGDTEVITVTPDHAGTFAYICSIPGHEEAGMVGEIVVAQ
jgi:nitrite reductase (NO-forming)